MFWKKNIRILQAKSFNVTRNTSKFYEESEKVKSKYSEFYWKKSEIYEEKISRKTSECFE